LKEHMFAGIRTTCPDRWNCHAR